MIQRDLVLLFLWLVEVFVLHWYYVLHDDVLGVGYLTTYILVLKVAIEMWEDTKYGCHELAVDITNELHHHVSRWN